MVSRADEAGAGGLSKTDEEREALAKQYVRHTDARSVHWTCPQCQQSNAELLQDRPRPRVDIAAELPGVPQAATQPGEEQKAPPNPEDTTALPPPETSAPACFDEPCEKEPANVSLQSTQPPMPAPTLERPLFPEPAASIVLSALQRQELSMLGARIESCRRMLLLLDSLMGLVCALLVLLLLKNL